MLVNVLNNYEPQVLLEKDVSKRVNSTNCVELIAWLTTQKNNTLRENNAKINLIDPCQMACKVDS